MGRQFEKPGLWFSGIAYPLGLHIARPIRACLVRYQSAAAPYPEQARVSNRWILRGSRDPGGVSRELRVLFLIAHDRQIEVVFHVELHPSSGREHLRRLTPRIHADARVVAAGGVYACPILAGLPGARLSTGSLAESFRPAPLYHPACVTCRRTGMSCRNS